MRVGIKAVVGVGAGATVGAGTTVGADAIVGGGAGAVVGLGGTGIGVGGAARQASVPSKIMVINKMMLNKTFLFIALSFLAQHRTALRKSPYRRRR